MYLYIDTTENLVLGLLNKNYEWLEYFEDNTSKISASIHHHMNEFLEKHSLDIKDISGLIFPAGPGSYTGMRVAEGISQIFNWQKIPSFSFYHFEVPAILGTNCGSWVAKAFKGEIFEYSWSGNDSSRALKKIKDFSFNKNSSYFSRSENLAPEINDGSIEYTKNVVKENPKELFHHIIKNKTKRELYYFREIEDEFSKS
jgi:tRNA threonylcarbamoyladenosine biosynthesis protein TsaB